MGNKVNLRCGLKNPLDIHFTQKGPRIVHLGALFLSLVITHFGRGKLERRKIKEKNGRREAEVSWSLAHGEALC